MFTVCGVQNNQIECYAEDFKSEEEAECWLECHRDIEAELFVNIQH